MGRGRNISVYLNEEYEKKIEDIRERLIEVDRMRFGEDFVERELAKKKFSRYSTESILKMMLNAGYDYLKRDLNLKYMEAKKAMGNDINDNPLIRLLVEQEMSKRKFGDIFRIF